MYEVDGKIEDALSRLHGGGLSTAQKAAYADYIETLQPYSDDFKDEFLILEPDLIK